MLTSYFFVFCVYLFIRTQDLSIWGGNYKTPQIFQSQNKQEVFDWIVNLILKPTQTDAWNIHPLGVIVKASFLGVCVFVCGIIKPSNFSQPKQTISFCLDCEFEIATNTDRDIEHSCLCVCEC